MDWNVQPEQEQGGAAWHQWRSKHIGASEAAAVMGVSPWTTRRQLWELKTGKRAPEPAGFAAQRGHRLEPIARERANEMLDSYFEPKVFDRGIFIASMDGWNESTGEGIEIKCVGKDTHALAKAGKIPLYYNLQIQQQYYVTDANIITYVSYFLPVDETDHTKADVVLVNIPRDDKLIDEYLLEAETFWKCVEENIEIPHGPKDTVDANDDVQLQQMVNRYKEKRAQFDLCKDQLTYMEKEIKQYVSDKGWWKCVCDHVRVSKYERKGSVDYSKVPQIDGVDLDQYRKKPSTVWKLEVI